MRMHRLLNGDCLKVMKEIDHVRMIFLDPPDNIGLDYDLYEDNLPEHAYLQWLQKVIALAVQKADIVWVSHNSAWTFDIGCIVKWLLSVHQDLEAKSNQQIFTFYQHNKYDLGQAHRPLVRFKWVGVEIYPDQIRIPSWRQLHGDKRANPNGKVPGDVFDFTRVVGNSKQRRKWHPTQLNEDLVERCVRLSCQPDDTVMDIFAGTGTTLRVCKRTGNPCILVELDTDYCIHLVREHEMVPIINGETAEWRCSLTG
jgi:DNA modification methylase